LGNINTARNVKLLVAGGLDTSLRATRGQRSLNEPADLRSFTLANQTGRVENPCVRHAWIIGERNLKGVPDRRRRHRVVG